MHQAMTQQSDPGKEENTVLEEFQKGYRLNGRVIRPSMVIVNKLPAEETEEQEEATTTEQTGEENEP
jgi:molecular chaperone GrpE